MNFERIVESLALHEREWLAGHLAGDGCVSVSLDKKRWPVLEVTFTKAENGLCVIDFLQTKFPGIKYCSRVETVSHQKTYIWRIRGEDAVSFCKGVSPYMYIKKDQYMRASEWPLGNMSRKRETTARHNDGRILIFECHKTCAEFFGVSPPSLSNFKTGTFKKCPERFIGWSVETQDKTTILGDRLQIFQDLQIMKSADHKELTNVTPSLPYFAGFFDADGSINAKPTGYLVATVTQKYRSICDAFCANFGGAVYEDKRRSFQWKITKEKDITTFLTSIRPFLMEKKAQADICLAGKLSLFDVEVLNDMNGLQGKKRTVTVV